MSLLAIFATHLLQIALANEVPARCDELLLEIHQLFRDFDYPIAVLLVCNRFVHVLGNREELF